MKTWKTKMFGDNRFNFYGWMIAALMIYAFSLLAIMQAINLGAWKTPEGLLLLAIYFVFIGQFSLGLSNYMARVSQTLDALGDAKTPPAK